MAADHSERRIWRPVRWVGTEEVPKRCIPDVQLGLAEVTIRVAEAG